MNVCIYIYIEREREKDCSGNIVDVKGWGWFRRRLCTHAQVKDQARRLDSLICQWQPPYGVRLRCGFWKGPRNLENRVGMPTIGIPRSLSSSQGHRQDCCLMLRSWLCTTKHTSKNTSRIRRISGQKIHLKNRPKIHPKIRSNIRPTLLQKFWCESSLQSKLCISFLSYKPPDRLFVFAYVHACA